MTFILNQLINRPRIYPDESLPSYVDRLATANHYVPIGMLDKHIQANKNRTAKSLGLTTEPLILERIAFLSNTPILQLYHATKHRFAEVLASPELTPSKMSLDGQEVPL